MNKIIEVRPLENYRIWLRFGDGARGELDLSDLVGRGVFAAWAAPDVFRAVRVEEGGGIEWPGEIDMCPDALYLRLTARQSTTCSLISSRLRLMPELSRFYGIVIKIPYSSSRRLAAAEYTLNPRSRPARIEVSAARTMVF